MPEIKDILNAVGATLQRKPEEIASLLKEDGSVVDNAADQLNNWIADNIKATRERDGKTFDNGYKKAQLEIATRIEKKIAESVGLQTDAKGDDFIAALSDHYSATSTAGSKLTEDDVKNHPVFKAKEKEWIKKLTEAEQSGKDQLEKFQKEVQRKETISAIHNKATEALFAKISLPEDPKKAAAQFKRLVLDPLSGYEYEADGDSYYILKDGKRVEDTYARPLTLEAHFTQIADENGAVFKEQSNRQSPNGDGKNEHGTSKVVLPKNEEEYAKMISDSSIPMEKRNEIQKAWKEQNSKP